MRFDPIVQFIHGLSASSNRIVNTGSTAVNATKQATKNVIHVVTSSAFLRSNSRFNSI
jgi:hypothetical protein